MRRISILKFQLTAAIIILTVLFISGFFIFGPSLTDFAKALSGNYSKGAADQLTASDWNNLDDDFVAKSGDAMSGSLSLSADPTNNMHAATKQYVDSVAIGEITNISGDNLRMVCGVGPIGGWMDYGIHAVQTTIDTSAAGFINDNVRYTVSLSGSNAGVAMGLDTIYNADIDSFDLHVQYVGWGSAPFPGITGAQANSWGWRVYWCGIGEQ